MQFTRCSNPVCNRPYQINEYVGKKTAEVPEEIVCPHCGHREIRFTDSVFLVHAMSPDEEAKFNKENP